MNAQPSPAAASPSPAVPVSEAATAAAAPVRQLTLFDSTCIIVGIIVGATIYESAPLIALTVGNTWQLIALWLAVGVLTLIGALCYVELGTAYPHEGGDYAYLTRAFGRRTGFVFAWVQLWVVRPGSIGAMAYVFATYAHKIVPFTLGSDRLTMAAWASAAIIVLTVLNILGIRTGKWTQNLLTALKVLGLLVIIAVAFFWAAPVGAEAATGQQALPLVLGLIFVFYAFGGWNEMAYVGAEVRNPERNIYRALVLGTIATTLVYLLVNVAFVSALGFGGLQQSKAVAADVLKHATGRGGELAISLLICVSALGVVNGMLFTGSRIYYAMGREHRLYRWLGQWDQRSGTPVPSLVIQAVITLAVVLGFGLLTGGNATTTARGAFDKMVVFTTPVFWFFLLLVGAAVFVLRVREPDTRRPFRVPLYPLVPAIFCLSSAFMLYKSTAWAYENKSVEALWSIGILVAGIALSFYEPNRSRSTAS